MKNIIILALIGFCTVIFATAAIKDSEKHNVLYEREMSYKSKVLYDSKPVQKIQKIVLNPEQKIILNQAKQIAISEGVKNPEFVQGIIMQETKAGLGDYIIGGAGNSIQHMYYGLGQIKVSTAKEMIKKFPALWNFDEEITDENIKDKLMYDDTFNIKTAVKLLKYLGINNNANFAITAYNKGLTGAKSVDHNNFAYTISVKNYSNSIKHHLS